VNTAILGKQIAEESRGSPDMDPRDVLTAFDRSIVGSDSVRLNLPLRDPVECRRHLALIEDTVHRLRLLLEERRPDRSLLFMVRGELRQLNRKLNAYRTTRRD
jgi:hypothetical protein